MKKNKVQYSTAPEDIGRAIFTSKVIPDFLPKPEDLVSPEENIKVTLYLSKGSINFFKINARKKGVSYQKMIKALLDLYTKKYA